MSYIDLARLVAEQLLQQDGERLTTSLLTLYVERQHQRGVALMLCLRESARVADVRGHESIGRHKAVTVFQCQRLGHAAVFALNHHIVPLQCSGLRVGIVQIVETVGLFVRCQCRNAAAVQFHGDGISRHRECRCRRLRLHRAVCLEDIDARHRHDVGVESLFVTIQIVKKGCMHVQVVIVMRLHVVIAEADVRTLSWGDGDALLAQVGSNI